MSVNHVNSVSPAEDWLAKYPSSVTCLKGAISAVTPVAVVKVHIVIY